jgi:hypothetical protein
MQELEDLGILTLVSNSSEIISEDCPCPTDCPDV